jgi:periplasmic protein TonB
MKNKLVLLFTFFASQFCLSQGADTVQVRSQKDSVLQAFVYADQMPEYRGGQTALQKDIAKNVNYPKKARMNSIEGKCFVRFVVNANGSIGKTEILKGVPNCPECDAAAVKAIKSLKKFIPGKNNGKPVPVWFQLPINFRLK